MILFSWACSSTQTVTTTTEELELTPTESFDPEWYLARKNLSIRNLADSVNIKSVAISFSSDSLLAVNEVKKLAISELYKLADQRAEIWKDDSSLDWSSNMIIKLRRTVKEYSNRNGQIVQLEARKSKDRGGYYAWASAELNHKDFIQNLASTFK